MAIPMWPWRQQARPPPTSAMAPTPPPSPSPTPPARTTPAPPPQPSPPPTPPPTSPAPPPPPASPRAPPSSAPTSTLRAVRSHEAAPPPSLAPPPGSGSPAPPPSSSSSSPPTSTIPLPHTPMPRPTHSSALRPGAPKPAPPPTATCTRVHLPSATPPPPPSKSPTLPQVPPPLRNFTATPLPAGPSPPAQNSEKSASLFGMLVPVVLYTFPFIYQVYTGSYDKTTKLFGTPAMVAAFVNSILWLMYGTVISKSDMNLSLLLLHAFISMSSFTYLMSVYADRRATRKGYMLGASFIISLSVIFIVMYWDPTPPKIIKNLFGFCGLGSLLYCHWIQIADILYGITERSQQIATAVILLPNCLVNLETLMITAQLHPSHDFILLSSTIGSVGNVLELLLIIIVTLGHFFLSTEKTNVDLEAATQNIHTSNVSGGVTTQNVASEMASTQDVTRVLGRDNSRVGPTLRQRQQEAIIIVQGTTWHEVIAVRNMLDTSSYTYTRVILEQSIPRIMLLIERDLYFPMLLHASGMTNTRPHPMMIRHLEIRYWLLNWLPLLEMARQQRWALAGSEIAVSDVLQLAGQDGIEESDVNRMERKQMKRKLRLTEEEVVPPPLPSNENKRIKLGKGSWIMHLPKPYALRRFRVSM